MFQPVVVALLPPAFRPPHGRMAQEFQFEESARNPNRQQQCQRSRLRTGSERPLAVLNWRTS
jgi:hypothetical protein